MVRKQLYITEGQAQALGVSEAELVRRAIDELLQERAGLNIRRREALTQLLDHTQHLAKEHHVPRDYHFDRDALYADRDYRQHRPTP